MHMHDAYGFLNNNNNTNNKAVQACGLKSAVFIVVLSSRPPALKKKLFVEAKLTHDHQSSKSKGGMSMAWELPHVT
jgi:hypothetical protein